MSRRMLWIVGEVVVLIIIVVLVIVLAPAKSQDSLSKKNTNQLSAAQKTSDTKLIEANVKTFFNSSTSMNQRVSLLQNGTQFAPAMESEFSQLDSEKPSVVISSVTFTNPTTANVVYSVELNSQPVLNHQTGQAVLVNNVWKVSDSTLCQLLSLGGSAPAACKNL